MRLDRCLKKYPSFPPRPGWLIWCICLPVHHPSFFLQSLHRCSSSSPAPTSEPDHSSCFAETKSVSLPLISFNRAALTALTARRVEEPSLCFMSHSCSDAPTAYMHLRPPAHSPGGPEIPPPHFISMIFQFPCRLTPLVSDKLLWESWWDVPRSLSSYVLSRLVSLSVNLSIYVSIYLSIHPSVERYMNEVGGDEV